MSPVHLLLALASVTEPVDALDDPSTAIPVDGGLMPTDELRDEPRTQALGAKVLFVNFDGGQMNLCGNNDPVGDCSTIFQGVVLAYSGDAVKRASVIQTLRQRVADFGVSVTDLRPESGAYDMEMVGNWQGEQPMFAGVAPNIDCFDNDGPEVSFTLESANTADGIAEVVWQEAAHTWGLEHVDDPTDLLYPTTSGSNKQFRDTCSKIVEDTMLNPSSGYCNQMHTQFCDSGFQNSYQELLELFGESIPDTIAPTIDITAPADGEVIVAELFELKVSFADDQHPVVIDASITLAQDGEPISEPQVGSYAGPSELAFPIEGLPPGEYTILVEGTDESDNPASDMITITIDDPATDESEGDGTTDGDGDDGADTTEDDGNDDGDDDDGSEGSDTGDPGETTTDRGCACRSAASPTASVALGLFVLALARRRRAIR